jgi:putative transposase
MGAREVTHAYRLRHWVEKISQCHNSGMTVTAWCESQNINIKSYYYWQKRVRDAASTELMKAQNCGSEKGLVPNGWAQVSEPGLSNCKSALTIDIGGCRITANEQTNPELLAKVCRILRSL